MKRSFLVSWSEKVGFWAIRGRKSGVGFWGLGGALTCCGVGGIGAGGVEDGGIGEEVGIGDGGIGEEVGIEDEAIAVGCKGTLVGIKAGA